MKEIEIQQLPVVRDPRGNLAFVQESVLLDHPISEVEWIYDVPDGTSQSGFTTADYQAVIIALSGSFDVAVITEDGSEARATLRRGSQALPVPANAKWEIQDFSTNSVALVIYSDIHAHWPENQEIIPQEGSSADPHTLSSIDQCRIVALPTSASTGSRTTAVINHTDDALMEVKRVFYLFDVPSGATRGGHSHFVDQQLIVAVSGSFTVVVDDGHNRKEFTLNRPNQGLYIPAGIWRELKDFSTARFLWC